MNHAIAKDGALTVPAIKTRSMTPIRSFEEAERYFRATKPFPKFSEYVPLAGHGKRHLALRRIESSARGKTRYQVMLHERPMIEYGKARFHVRPWGSWVFMTFIEYHLPQAMRLAWVNRGVFIHAQDAYYEPPLEGMWFDSQTLQPVMDMGYPRQRPVRNRHYRDTLKFLREYRAWHTVMRRLHGSMVMVNRPSREQLTAIEQGNLHDLCLVSLETDKLVAYLMHQGPRPGYTLACIDNRLPLKRFPPEVRKAYPGVTLS